MVEVDGSIERVATNMVLVKRLQKRTTKLELKAVAESAGIVLNIFLWHGFGQGCIEFESEKDADKFMEQAPITIHGRQVVIQKGYAMQEAQRLRADETTPEFIAKEVGRCVQRLLTKVDILIAQEGAHKRRSDHAELMAGMVRESKAKGIREDICWEFVVTGGKCYRGSQCRFTHEMVPITDIPAKFRWYVQKDTFPAIRELSPDKAKVNSELLTLISRVDNRRCLVLDGMHCNSVRTLRSHATAPREPHEIVVPNNCSETYLAIRASGLCTAYHGSVRAFLDSSPHDRFGLVYLDYCCRLHAGKFRVEKSPVGDLKALFRHGSCDAAGCILCVCLCKEDGDFLDQPQQLRHLVTKFAALNGLVAVCHPHRHSYLGTFAEIFYVASAAHISRFFSYEDVQAVEDG